MADLDADSACRWIGHTRNCLIWPSGAIRLKTLLKSQMANFDSMIAQNWNWELKKWTAKLNSRVFYQVLQEKLNQAILTVLIKDWPALLSY